MKCKRLFASALALMLGGTMLFSMAACGGKESKGDGKVVMTYLTMPSAKTSDIDKVEAAINKKTQKEIGVTVELYPISIMDQSKYTTLIAGGERLDVVCVALTDPTTFSQVGVIKKLSMDDITEYMPGVVSLANEGWSLYSKDAKGNTIGISTLEYLSGTGGSYVVRKADLEAVGLAETYKDQQHISYSDLDTIFAALKTKYPDSYPSGNLADVSGFFIAKDGMGASTASGVLNLSTDITSTTVVNYYETDEYKQYVAKMVEWNNKGYVHPDALTTEESSINLFSSGVFRGTYLDCWPNLRDEYATRCGEEVVQLQLMDPYSIPITGAAGITWALGGKCQDEVAAMKFINAMMTDKELVNMLQWGIEGTHFKVIDEEVGVIDFPEGVDGTTSGFYNTLGLYGDKRSVYTFLSEGQTVADVKATQDLMLDMAEKANKRTSPAAGFMYDTTKKKAVLSAVANVIATYSGNLAVGKNGKYDEFISELKKAGINELIADKQAQFDAWRNAQ